MRMRTGKAERMTRVRAQERVKARMRQVRQVVRYWMILPVVREEARRGFSVSLGRVLAGQLRNKEEKMDKPSEGSHEATSTDGGRVFVAVLVLFLRGELRVEPVHGL